jgi:hypothetical protein
MPLPERTRRVFTDCANGCSKQRGAASRCQVIRHPCNTPLPLPRRWFHLLCPRASDSVLASDPPVRLLPLSPRRAGTLSSFDVAHTDSGSSVQSVCRPFDFAPGWLRTERRIWVASERNLSFGGQILLLRLRMIESMTRTPFSESVSDHSLREPVVGVATCGGLCLKGLSPIPALQDQHDDRDRGIRDQQLPG